MKSLRILPLFLFSGAALAQSLNWLPVSDLPLTNSEIGGGPVPPGVSSMCLWDPDGDGPLPKCVVVAGSLQLSVPGGRYTAFFDGDGWVGLNIPTTGGIVYSMLTYAAPGRTADELYVAQESSGVRRFDGTTWTSVFGVTQARCMYLTDLDGDGPQDRVLLAGGASDVYSWNGTVATRLRGGTLNPSTVRSLLKWDFDGAGPNAPLLLAGCPTSILAWNGSVWSQVVATNGPIYTLCSFDFDGDGPGAPELIASGDFTVIGGVNTGPVAVLRNGAWESVGATSYAGAYLARTISFDPDGPGPMTPWLVVSGQFTQIGGVAAPNLAYYNDGAWHTFPQYWFSESVCLEVNDGAGFSDSPQLLVAALRGARPSYGAFALSNNRPGFLHDPAGGRRPAGETISLGVVPSGDELSFRWYKGETLVMSGTTASGSVITGAASPRLTISGLTPQDAGEYHLRIGNSLGVVETSPAPVSLGCASDFNADDVVDFTDYLDFVTAFGSGSAASDFNGDQSFDIFDYLDFVNMFSAGC